jgi:hypothetical protein
MIKLKLLLLFVFGTFSILTAQSNSVVNFGITGESVMSTDGYIDDQNNKIVLLSTESGVAIGSFNSIYAPNWIKKVADYSSTVNKLIALSNGDFVALISQDYSYASHILKFDASGNIDWHKKLQGPPASNLNDLIQVGTDKIAFVGRNGVDAIYSAIDFNGNLIYSKTFDCASYPSIYPIDILPTGDGNHLIISQILGSDSPKALLSKFDGSGNLLWNKVHDFPYTATLRNGIVSNHNDIFIVGNYNPSMAIGDLNSKDLLLLKFSSTGDFLQAKTYGNEFEEDAYDLELVEDGTFLAVNKLKSSENCSGNLLIVNFDQNLDTLYTKIYGTQIGNGAFYYELHRRGTEYYSFGHGSLWTNIGTLEDAHLIQSDRYFDLECEYFDSGLLNSGTLSHNLITPIVNYPDFNPNFIIHTQASAISLIVKDGCTDAFLQKEELEQSQPSIIVYPIPAAEYVNIRMLNTELEELEIYDMMGRIIHKQIGEFNKELSIQISDWPNQSYLLVLKHSNGVQYERVQKH